MANFSIASSLQSLERLFIAPWKIAATPDTTNVKRFFTPLDQAVAEIEKRRQDPALMQAVTDFLNNDIPEHFRSETPIFYLSRHVATPNYETLRYIELTKEHSFPTVIGQDPVDKFVSNNVLKRCLGKLPVTKGYSHNGDEIVEFFTLIDFDKYQGRPLADVQMKNGENLITFHNNLLEEIYPTGVKLTDDSDWIDRNERGQLYEHYVKFLSLLVVNGIMYEFYEPEDETFVRDVLAPAFTEVTNRFGKQPLIVNLVPEEMALERNWNGYPSIVYPYIKQSLE